MARKTDTRKSKPVGIFRARRPEEMDYDGVELFRNFNSSGNWSLCPYCGKTASVYSYYDRAHPQRELHLGDCPHCGSRWADDDNFDIVDINTGKIARIKATSSDGEWYVTEVWPINDSHRVCYLMIGNAEYCVYVILMADGKIVMSASGSDEDDPTIYDLAPEEVITAARMMLAPYKAGLNAPTKSSAKKTARGKRR